MYLFITRLLPSKIRNHLYKILTYSRMNVNKERFIGLLLILGFLFAIGIALFTFRLFHINFFLNFLIWLVILSTTYI